MIQEGMSFLIPLCFATITHKQHSKDYDANKHNGGIGNDFGNHLSALCISANASCSFVKSAFTSAIIFTFFRIITVHITDKAFCALYHALDFHALQHLFTGIALQKSFAVIAIHHKPSFFI